MGEPNIQVTSTQAVDEQVAALLQQMTLAEKVGQMTQVEKNSIAPEDVTRYHIGSVLSGGGGNPTPNNAAAWLNMVREYQQAALATRLSIPLIYGSDSVHGHNNVHGATIFPHNIGLGAAGDANLVERIGRATAVETLATGVHWAFGPALSVPHDIRWGRTYEGYSQDPTLVGELGTALVRGLQDGSYPVIGSAKHFVGDGGTIHGTTRAAEWIASNWQNVTENYKLDQGDTQLDEATLREVHLAPYLPAIAAGVQSIMVSFSSWNGLKMHAHHYLLTEVLKGELGYEGLLVSDWMALDQIDADYAVSIVKSINAGLDMIMVPYDYKHFIETLTVAVERGDVAMSRIDDAVSRILRVKAWLGVFEEPLTDPMLLAHVGVPAHRKLAREAAQRSQVLLKNEGDVLPLAKDTAQVLLAGRGADNIGMQCGGWSIDWQGGHGPITVGTSILDGVREHLSQTSELIISPTGESSQHVPVGIVVVGEDPYAEGLGDTLDPVLPDADIAAIKTARQHCDKLIVVLLTGRPLFVADWLDEADALVCAWLPGSEAAGVADTLFGAVPFTGKLRYDWPRSLEQVPLSALQASDDGPQFAFGAGITTA